MMTANSLLLTIQEAADRCRVSVRTLEREAADGKIALVRIRSKRMIELAELDRYIAEQRGIAQVCQSDAKATATRSASVLAAANALKRLYQPAPPMPTRSRSKLRCSSAASTLKLVDSRSGS